MSEPKPNLLEHVVQKDIVKTLVGVGSARFSELKPKRVESNLFMYHLKQLIKAGIIEKDDTTYRLTAQGRMFVDRANLDHLVFRVQPKIVNILAIRSGKGNWLLLQRKHEPHIDRIGFPSGKLHYGERLEEAAHRELQEKTGLSGLDLKLTGNVLMRFLDKDTQETVNHTIGYVFFAELADEPKITNSSMYWRSYWGPETQLLDGNVFKGHQDILRLLAENRLCIESLDYESDY